MKPAPHRAGSFLLDAAPWLLLVGSLGATAAATFEASRAAANADSLREEQLLQRCRTNIEGRLSEHIAIIRATSAFFEAQPYVNQSQFRQFIEKTGFFARYPGALAIVYAPVITPETRAYAAEFIRRSGVTPRPSPFQASPGSSSPGSWLRGSPWPSSFPARRIPMVFAAPETKANLQSAGFDLYANATRRPYLKSAIETGQLVFTPKLELLGSPGETNLTGFIVITATYGIAVPPSVDTTGGPSRSSSLTTPAERWRNVRGIVYTTFRANVFFDLSLRDPELNSINIEVYDGPIRPGNLLYTTARPTTPSELSSVTPVVSSNRVWLVRSTPTRAFTDSSSGRWVPLVGVIGVVISGLAFAVGFQQRKARRQSDTDAARLREEVEVRQRAEIEVRRLNQDLESTVQLRTAELQAANEDLEAFVYSVSHDLRAPLRAIDGFSQVVMEDYGDRLDADGVDSLNRVRRASARMDRLITALLGLSRITRTPVHRQRLDLTRLVRETADAILTADASIRGISAAIPVIVVADRLYADADEQLVTVVFDNLLRNAIKFSRGRSTPRIEVGAKNGVFWVRDNGVGFNPTHADKLFQPFERLHSESEFPGTGIGLATVQRIVRRHGGEICAEGEENVGATFYFTLAPTNEITSCRNGPLPRNP